MTAMSEIDITFATHNTEELHPPRRLSQAERKLLDRLLSVDFEAHDKVREQLERVQVGAVCTDCPTIWFEPGPLPRELIIERRGKPLQGIVSCELEGGDRDGVPISVLLHVYGGHLDKLEVVRADGKPILEMPGAENFDVICSQRPPDGAVGPPTC